MLARSTLWFTLAVGAQGPLAAPSVEVVTPDPVRVEYATTSRDNHYEDGGEPFGEDRLVCEVADVDGALEVRFEAMRDYGLDTKVTLIRTDEGRTRAEVSAVRRLPSSSGHGTDITEVTDVHGSVQLARPDWSPGHDVRLEFEVMGTLEGAPVKLRGGWNVRNDTARAGLAKLAPAVRETSISSTLLPRADEIRVLDREGALHSPPEQLVRWHASPMTLAFDATNRLVGEDLSACLVGGCVDVFAPGVLEFDVCDARRCDGRFARVEWPVSRGRFFAVFAWMPGAKPTSRWIVWPENGQARAWDCDVPKWARASSNDTPIPSAPSVLPRWTSSRSPFDRAISVTTPSDQAMSPADDGRRVLHAFSWNGARSDEIVKRLGDLDASLSGPTDEAILSHPLYTTPLAQWPEPVWFVRLRFEPSAK